MVSTIFIVDTMQKLSEIPRYAARRTKRSYSASLKAELLSACQAPGASIAAVASTHWAAAGFKDTLLRWNMKLEVANGHEKEIQSRVQA
jgi:transposase-like protein